MITGKASLEPDTSTSDSHVHTDTDRQTYRHRHTTTVNGVKGQEVMNAVNQ